MSHRNAAVSGVVVALAALAGACSDPTRPTGPDSPAPNLSLGAASSGSQVARGLDAMFLEIAAEMPGFGGMFYDGSGRLHVYLARGQLRTAGAEDAVVGAVGRSLRARGRPAPGRSEVVIQDGDYGFADLSRWQQSTLPLLGVPGVTFTDIDEARNRLRVGISGGTSEEQVQLALEQLAIPRDAVLLQPSEPFIPVSSHTLRDLIRPLGGGLQIVWEFPGIGFFLCTLGFNVRRGAAGASQNFFVTASHCTGARGTVAGTEYFQHSPFVADPATTLVAREVLDPPFFTNPCFTGFVCRFSDAGLAEYFKADNVAVKFGSIYRTLAFGTGTPGSLEIETVERKFFTIVGEAPFPLIGEVLDKTGRTTGWTRGPVVGTCLNVGVSGSNVAMLCQDIVLAAVGGGDSGSPVYRQIGTSKNAVLYGLLWGSAGSLFIFSALDNIRFELGTSPRIERGLSRSAGPA